MFSDGLHWGLHWATPGRRAEALLQGLFSYKYLCEAKPKKLYWDLEKQKLLLLVYRSPPLGHLKSGAQRRVQKPPFQLDPRISSACMQGLYLQRQDRRGTVFSFLMGLTVCSVEGGRRQIMFLWSATWCYISGTNLLWGLPNGKTGNSQGFSENLCFY